MESEIYEVLEILRRPPPSDSLLEFIVSEDGYKKIIEEREKSNLKVSYDSQSRTAIICFPTSLHERTSLMAIDSMVYEVAMTLPREYKNAGHETTANSSRKRSYQEPDGLIIFDEVECIDARRIAFELGFSQSYSSLRRATLWWIEQNEATVAVLLCLTEVDKNSGAAHRVFRNIDDRKAEIQTYGIEFNRQRRQEHRPLGPLEYNGNSSCESEPVYLVKDGVDVSEEIPRDLSAIKVAYNWLSDDVVRRLPVNFLQPQRFMEGLSNPIVRTALSRVEDTFEVQEY
ncbi:hypothetical protein V1524DRAFT_418303 [Lipomyces starkeyi]